MPRLKKSARIALLPKRKRADGAPTVKRLKKQTKEKRRKFRRVPKTSYLETKTKDQIKRIITNHNRRVCIKKTGNKATLIRRLQNAKKRM